MARDAMVSDNIAGHWPNTS